MKKIGAFTVRTGQTEKWLKCKVSVKDPLSPENNDVSWEALWDTGATCTFISKRVAETLNLQPITVVPVDSIKERDKEAKQYYISLQFPNAFETKVLAVEWPSFSGGVNVVIGMDVIGKGDFSVTNKGRKTTFSFRIPSVREIDYEQEPLSEE